MLSYPNANGERSEIKIARMDMANTELFRGMGTDPAAFSSKVIIFIVKEGKLQRYQGFMDVPAELYH